MNARRQWPSDELYHWKYIKKKKVNGKWRYYYADEGPTNDARNEMLKSKRADDRMLGELVGASQDLEDAKQRSKGTLTYELAEAMDRYEDIRVAAQATRDRAEESVRKYKAMKIISFPQRAIGKGIAALGNLIRKAFGN